MATSWDPDEWSGVKDVPIVGDVWSGLWGDPEAVKTAYDAQIQASKDSQLQLQQFLMGKKGEAKATYAPMRHMFQSMYGTEGMQAPQTPQTTQGPQAQGGQLQRMASR